MDKVVAVIKLYGPLVIFFIGWLIFINMSQRVKRNEKILKRICEKLDIEIKDID